VNSIDTFWGEGGFLSTLNRGEREHEPHPFNGGKRRGGKRPLKEGGVLFFHYPKGHSTEKHPVSTSDWGQVPKNPERF